MAVRTRWAGAFFVAVLLSAGCSEDEAAAPEPSRTPAGAAAEAAFLGEMRKGSLGGFNEYNTDDKNWLGLGYATCHDLDKGKSVNVIKLEQVGKVVLKHEVTEEQVDALLQSAVTHLCPDRAGALS